MKNTRTLLCFVALSLALSTLNILTRSIYDFPGEDDPGGRGIAGLIHFVLAPIVVLLYTSVVANFFCILFIIAGIVQHWRNEANIYEKILVYASIVALILGTFSTAVIIFTLLQN
jgi:hypothetical protein